MCVFTHDWSVGCQIRGTEGSPGREVCLCRWALGGQAGVLTASPLSADDRICSPPFMELTSLCGEDTMRLLEKNGLTFPFSVYPPGLPWADGRAADAWP